MMRCRCFRQICYRQNKTAKTVPNGFIGLANESKCKPNRPNKCNQINWLIKDENFTIILCKNG